MNEPADLAAALRALPLLPEDEIEARAALLRGLHADLAAPESPERAAAVEETAGATGYHPIAVEQVLRGLFSDLASGLDFWLDAARSADSSVRLRPPRLVLVTGSGNIPGASLPAVAGCLLLGSACLVKSASGEPVLMPLYQRWLREREPRLAERLAVCTWRGGDRRVESPLLEQVDAVIAFGNDASLEDLRQRIPAGVTFAPYGSRVSFSVVTRAALTPERIPSLATRLALDAALLDQQGCLSPQAVYLESTAGPEQEHLARAAARKLAELEETMPRRPLSSGEAMAIHNWRMKLRLRRAAGEPVMLLESPGGTAWSVAVDPDAALRPCPLNRCLVLHPLPDLEQLPALLAPQRGRLSSAGLDCAGDEKRRLHLEQLLIDAGVSRIVPPGQAQLHVSPWSHDGIHLPARLLRPIQILRP